MKNISVIILTLIILALTIFYAYRLITKLNQDNIPRATDASLSDIKAKKRLIIGTYPKIPPMTFYNLSGSLSGVDIDIAKKIASQIGVSPEFKEMTFPEMFTAIQDGSVDILISSITITPERERLMLFSIPYFDSGQVIVVRKETEFIKQIEDLNSKKVGVIKGTTGEKAAKDLLKKSFIESYEDLNQINKALKRGELDALIEDLSGASGLVKNDPAFKIIGDPFTDEYYGVVVNLNSRSLMNEINGILREMKKSGELKSITEKWLRA